MDPTALDRTAAAPASPPDPAIAGRIGRFALLRQLGSGAMGIVYAAYDEELDRRIAIKLLHGGEGDSTGRGRMLREAQAMARLSHPHVVQIYEVGVHAQQVYVAMEYVDGDTLAHVQRDRSPAEILALYLQAGEGLAAAHAAGLVHRDFKPDNVLVGKDGRVRVGDFGLARAQGHDDLPAPSDLPLAEPVALAATTRQSAGNLLVSPLTRVGELVGTPAYMSPEQLRGVVDDARSDQFSFCAALYEALYGQRPFAGDTLMALTGSVLAGALRPPPPDHPAPAWLLPLLARGLARDPADRFPTMSALLAELGRDVLRDPRQGQAERRRFAKLMLVALALITLMLSRGGLGDRFLADPYDIVRSAVLALASLVLGIGLFGRPLLRNQHHRAVIAFVFLAALQMLLVRLVLLDADVPLLVVLRVDFLVNAIIAALAAFLVAPWFWWGVALCTIAVVVNILAPASFLPLVQVFYPGLVLIFLFGWNHSTRRAAA